MDLTRYVSAVQIEQAAMLNTHTKCDLNAKTLPESAVNMLNGAILSMVDDTPGVTREDRINAALLVSLCPLIEGGAKLIKPSAAAAQAAGEIELNLTFADYAQPYFALGVILPKGLVHEDLSKEILAGSINAPALSHIGEMLLIAWWRPEIGMVLTFAHGVRTSVFVIPLSAFANLVEEWFHDFEDYHKLDPRMAAAMIRLIRVGLNMCLFAMERTTRLAPLDAQAAKRANRAARDPRMARLALRDARELVIQDLDLILAQAPPADPEDPQGLWKVRPHRRRGHWKMQVHGAGRALRKRIYVPSYLVNVAPGQAVETTLT